MILRENDTPVDPARVKTLAADLVLTGPLTVERIAAHLGASPRSLQRHLSEQGVSLRELVEECRIGVAKVLLSKTDLAVHEIAQRTGYATSSGLARAFVRSAGCSPTVYRKTVRASPHGIEGGGAKWA